MIFSNRPLHRTAWGLALAVLLATTAGIRAEPPASPPQIWVMRHGEDGGADRALTERGREQAAEAARTFAEIRGLTIWTSPKLRTRQTAAIVHERVPGSTLVVLDWLDHARPLPDDWWTRLPEGPVLLVTHQPVVHRMLRDRERPSAPVGHAFVARLDDPSP